MFKKIFKNKKICIFHHNMKFDRYLDEYGIIVYKCEKCGKKEYYDTIKVKKYLDI